MAKYPLKVYFDYSYRLIWWLINFWQFKKIAIFTYVGKPIKITKSCIECEKKVYISKNCRIEGIYKYNDVFFSPEIIFKEGVTIQQNLHLTCGNSVIIDKNTAIGANVTITDIIHPYENIFLAIEKHDIVVKEVYIGPDSKIYNNSVILPGVRIGKHVVVGANSVVVTSIEDFTLVAGAPAKPIKRFDQKKEQWVSV